MSRVYGDPIEVHVTDGRPARFTWRGRLYTVRRVIEHWVTTRDWWRESAAPPENDVTAENLVRDFWRVEATPEGADVGVYELRHDEAEDAWLLSRAWD